MLSGTERPYSATSRGTFSLKRIDGGPELIWLFLVLFVVIYLPVAVGIVAISAARVLRMRFRWVNSISGLPHQLADPGQ